MDTNLAVIVLCGVVVFAWSYLEWQIRPGHRFSCVIPSCGHDRDDVRRFTCAVCRLRACADHFNLATGICILCEASLRDAGAVVLTKPPARPLDSVSQRSSMQVRDLRLLRQPSQTDVIFEPSEPSLMSGQHHWHASWNGCARCGSILLQAQRQQWTPEVMRWYEEADGPTTTSIVEAWKGRQIVCDHPGNTVRPLES